MAKKVYRTKTEIDEMIAKIRKYKKQEAEDVVDKEFCNGMITALQWCRNLDTGDLI